jgi:hypothetical protein
MPDTCPECGAPVSENGSCRDLFHTLLLLEGEIAGVAGSVLHFYAVAAYLLQHPNSMGATTEALASLRRNVADALDGRATVDDLRRRARYFANGPQRVQRREGEASVPWPRGNWPTTIADVCTPESFGSYETYDAYAERVIRWARSILETLDRDRSEALS